MQVTIDFPNLGPNHSRPWFAVIKGWPDKGPPVMAFGKLVKGSNPPRCTVEAQLGDIVRWGIKDASTGVADPAHSGFGIVRPGGLFSPIGQDEAKARRRQAHPEDAQLAPVSVGGGFRGRRGGGRGTSAPSPVPGLSVQEAATIAALIHAAQTAVRTWTDFNHDRVTAQDMGQAMVILDGILAGFQASAAPAATSAPEPEAQEPEAQEPEPEPEEPVAPRAPAPLPVDDDGFPLF